MHPLPGQWSSLCVLVFLLGLRHGFDADHLAAIGIDRWSGNHEWTVGAGVTAIVLLCYLAGRRLKPAALARAG